ncbi:MAG: SurA N-terminal domain-containing protein [Proteobacteria bacterium]|nr:SurA N-terminal domain-containing protein [Pseudomonadota bacterium]
MLKSIRKGLNSFVVLALMGLLIASFAIWGIGDIFTARGLAVAEVGQSQILATDFLRRFQNRVRALSTQLGGDFDTQQAIAMGLHQAVLAELIQKATLDEEARVLGIRGTDMQVATMIREMDAFEGIFGGFDKGAYESALFRVGLTPQQFENDVRLDIARLQLLRAVDAAVPQPGLYARTIYAFRKEQRRAKVLTIPASSVSGLEVPDEAALMEYHQTNSRYFMTPEYRDISYMVLSPADFAGEMDLSDDELREEYEIRLDQYVTPDLRGVELVTFQEESKARAFATRYAAGEDFALLAEDLTGFTAEELVLGEQSYFDIEEDFSELAAERLFETPLNGVTAPIQTLFGWNIFRVTKILPGSAESFEEVRDALVREVAQERGLDAMYDVSGRVDDEIAGGAPIEDVAEATSVELLRESRVTRSGTDAEGNLVGSLAHQPIFSKAFEVDGFTELELFETADGGFFLVQVNDVFPPRLKPFEEIRDQALTLFYADTRQRIAGENANAALRAAGNGQDFASIAATYGGTVFQTPLLQRDNIRGQSGVSSSVGRLIFSLEKGGVDLERAATGDGYVVVQVTEIIAGDHNQSREELAQLTQAMKEELTDDLMAQYQAAVQRDISLSINQPLIDAMMTPDGLILPASPGAIPLQ